MQAQLHNATAYNAGTEALKGQTLAVGSAKAAVIQFAAAGGYDGAVTVEISPDAGTTWFALQAESLAALGTYVSSITSFTPAYRVIVPSQVQLRCRMSGGSTGSLTVSVVPTTFAIPKVVISPPENSVVPTLSTGTPIIGIAITITPGTWTQNPTLTYQWQRNTGSWVNIGGATSSSYTPVNADFGYRLRVVETGTNGAGSASANSAATSIPVTESSLFGWWDSSDLSTLFQDSAATTPVASVSDPVGAWVEKTGKNRTFQQAGASTIKPAYQGAGSGISFDGGDYLTLYSQSTNFTAQTVIAVVKLEAAGNIGARVFNQVSAASNDYAAVGHYIPIRRASSLTSVGGYAAGGDRSQVTNANGVKSVIVARHSGSAIVNRINGVNGSSYSHTLNYTPERMRLMSNMVSANDGPGETGAGTYYELFVFSTEISAGLLAAIETLVNTKWP